MGGGGGLQPEENPKKIQARDCFLFFWDAAPKYSLRNANDRKHSSEVLNNIYQLSEVCHCH